MAAAANAFPLDSPEPRSCNAAQPSLQIDCALPDASVKDKVKVTDTNYWTRIIEPEVTNEGECIEMTSM